MSQPLVLSVALLSLVVSASDVRAQDPQPTPYKIDVQRFIKDCARLRPAVKIDLDIDDMELQVVANLFACMSGRSVIFAECPRGRRISVHASSPVTASEGYNLFLDALVANGIPFRKWRGSLQIGTTGRHFCPSVQAGNHR